MEFRKDTIVINIRKKDFLQHPFRAKYFKVCVFKLYKYKVLKLISNPDILSFYMECLYCLFHKINEFILN